MRQHFECLDDGLVRAPARAPMHVPSWPDLLVDDPTPTDIAACTDWIKEVWADAAVMDVVRFTSPDLARQTEQVACGAAMSVRRVRKVVLSLIGYLLRHRRPTPLGLVAGVAPAVFGARTETLWGTAHTARTSASGPFISDVITMLEAMEEVRSLLPVVANSSLVRRGGDVVLPWRPRPVDATTTAVRAVSVEATPAVVAALDLAQQPVVFRDLAAELGDGSVDEEQQARRFLEELLGYRLLISALHAPSTETDALGYLLEQLTVCGAGKVESASGLVEALSQIHAGMRAHDRAPASEARVLRENLVGRMNAISARRSPLALDVRLDASVVVSRRAGREAARAAGVLAQISAQPQGPAVWAEYRSRFEARYGHTTVPLAELVDPSAGLGLPAGFLGAQPAQASVISGRDRRLMALAQQAAVSGIREVVLDDALIEALSTSGEPTLPAHLEMSFTLVAKTAKDVDAGRFEVWPQEVTRHAGRLTGGRFAALLDTASQDGVVAALAQTPALRGDALPVQLSFPSMAAAGAHLTRVPRLLNRVISFGEYQQDRGGVITMDDLVVGCDDQGLYLASRALGRRLEGVVLHSLQVEFHTPTVARFVAELARSSAAEVAGFDWGVARHLPYLPRVRYGRVVLSPERWLMTHVSLPGPDATNEEWSSALAYWRGRMHVPDQVELRFWDERIPLDLGIPAHRAMLRSELRRQKDGPLYLVELPEPGGDGWCGGRPTELVALLHAAPAPADPEVSPLQPSAPRHHAPGAAGRIRVQVKTATGQHSDIIASWLANSATLDTLTPWWATPAGHDLELVIKPEPGAYADTARYLSAFTQTLIDNHLARDVMHLSWQPDTKTWGEDERLELAEAFLAADARVLHSTRIPAAAGIDPAVLAAVNVLAIVADFDEDADRGLSWLSAQPSPRGSGPIPPGLVAQTVVFASVGTGRKALREAAGEAATRWWPGRTAAITAYRKSLRPDTGPTPDATLRHLIGAHLERLPAGTDPRLGLRIARAAARAHILQESR